MLTSKIAAAPLASARRTAPSFLSPAWLNTNTALPRTSLPAKSASLPEPGVHGFDIDTTGGQRVGAVERLRAFEVNGLPAPVTDRVPGLRHPLGLEVERLDAARRTGRRP